MKTERGIRRKRHGKPGANGNRGAALIEWAIVCSILAGLILIPLLNQMLPFTSAVDREVQRYASFQRFLGDLLAVGEETSSGFRGSVEMGPARFELRTQAQRVSQTFEDFPPVCCVLLGRTPGQVDAMNFYLSQTQATDKVDCAGTVDAMPYAALMSAVAATGGVNAEIEYNLELVTSCYTLEGGDDARAHMTFATHYTPVDTVSTGGVSQPLPAPPTGFERHYVNFLEDGTLGGP